MPTLARVRMAVDDRLADLWVNQIVPRQNDFFAARGRYWQGLRTNMLRDLPDNPDDADNTVREVVPVRTTHPTDQAETWTDSGIDLGATLPCVLVMDVYDGPRGHGYVGQVWVAYDGNVYTRSMNNGPESYRTSPWRRLTAEEIAQFLDRF